MAKTVIKVENLSKQYRLGEVGTGTLGHDLNRWWHTIRGKEDPYATIGEANDRTSKGNSEYVWALQDINFEVKQGEVLGIIGRNGAGKSTLLKILSRTTTPTTGSVKVKGRIASLLEVGTGFHPELSGRENIFLNGAILGMTKQEIKSKFDEIVDFAGVERYIDTPVKRYSSGMYVRLAFGVAAHLEPEILIVDEVLAVGDAEFQKKALGKMKDVSTQDGRTVLFVSHNVSAMKELCSDGLFLQNGRVMLEGNINAAIDEYLANGKSSLYYTSDNDITKTFGQINSIELFDEDGVSNNSFRGGSSPYAQLTYTIKVDTKNFNVGFTIFDIYGNHIYSSSDTDLLNNEQLLQTKKVGTYKVKVKFPLFNLNTGNYRFKVVLGQTNVQLYDFAEVQFSILNKNFLNHGNRPGLLISLNEWNYFS